MRGKETWFILTQNQFGEIWLEECIVSRIYLYMIDSLSALVDYII